MLFLVKCSFCFLFPFYLRIQPFPVCLDPANDFEHGQVTGTFDHPKNVLLDRTVEVQVVLLFDARFAFVFRSTHHQGDFALGDHFLRDCPWRIDDDVVNVLALQYVQRPLVQISFDQQFLPFSNP